MRCGRDASDGVSDGMNGECLCGASDGVSDGVNGECLCGASDGVSDGVNGECLCGHTLLIHFKLLPLFIQDTESLIA